MSSTSKITSRGAAVSVPAAVCGSGCTAAASRAASRS
jgi:hypothetical protein